MAVFVRSTIPHVSCNSHKLNLEVNKMVDSAQGLNNTIESVHNTMKACKLKLNNAAILRNLTVLKPQFHNNTRWSSMFHMLQCFVLIRNMLVEVSEHVESDIEMNTSEQFKIKVIKYASCTNRSIM